MKCDVCGLEYSMTHACGGPPLAVVLPTDAPEEETPPPPGLLPLHYAREAFLIAVWNGDAIRRASRDRKALGYGIFVWLIANSVSVLVPTVLASAAHPLRLLPILVSLIWVLVTGAVLSLAQVGLCFLAAKWFMGAEGRFINVLRPLLLGSVVYVLAVIPYAGLYLAALAWICVFAMVFQVVADVEALSAYLLSTIVGLAFRVLESKLFGAFG